jgi:hypothetical protein
MSFKAQELAHNLASELKIRMSDLVVTESFDTNGDPTIFIGALTAGSRSAIIRVKAIDWPLAKDVLGLASTIYTPHVIQLLTESNPTAGAGADILTAQDELTLIATIAKRGTLVEWYKTANTVAVTVAAIITGNLKASYDAELYWNMLASQ